MSGQPQPGPGGGQKRAERFVAAFERLQKTIEANCQVIDQLGKLIAEELIPAIEDLADQVENQRIENSQRASGVLGQLASIVTQKKI